MSESKSCDLRACGTEAARPIQRWRRGRPCCGGSYGGERTDHGDESTLTAFLSSRDRDSMRICFFCLICFYGVILDLCYVTCRYC
uniref:Uncharacterized protein n=1 Tax=Arundo donax TaxID=35708 RepID=A0A0A9CFF4_ARUDO